MLDGTHYFECDCGSVEHTLRFVIDKEDNELHTEIFLDAPYHWWVRVWIGIKYIFGYKCRYGHWDCWVLNINDAIRLRDMCKEVIKGART